MDVYTAIANRKSVRTFQDREVPEELLLRLLEAARFGAFCMQLSGMAAYCGS